MTAEAVRTARARVALSTIDAAAARITQAQADMGFNPLQKRGPDGRWIKMGGRGSATPRPSGGRGGGRGGSRPKASDYGDFVPTPDGDWAQSQQRLGDRTPVLDPGALEVGSVVPLGSGTWGEIEEAPGAIAADMAVARRDGAPDDMVVSIPRLTRMMDAYKAERAWRDAGGVATIEAKTSPPPDAPLAQRQAALSEGVASGVGAAVPLGNGLMGDVRRVQFNDGTSAVSKQAKGSAFAAKGGFMMHTATDQNAAEELASLVGGVLGMGTPAVHRQSDTLSYIELMPGRTGTEIDQTDGAQRLNELSAAGGPLLGLMDVLTDNGDRNTGNWLIDDSGRMFAIDQGMAFASRHNSETTSGVRSPFAAPYINKSGQFKAKNPLTPSDVDKIRGRLEGLRSTFADRDRTPWLDQMLARLDQLAAGAKGTTDLIA